MGSYSNDPLVQALPPVTDDDVYLSLVRNTLSTETLKVLESILRDSTLTERMGAPIVPTLLQLYPASRTCLWLVSRSGDPQAVLLTVADALRLLEWEQDEEPEWSPGSLPLPWHFGGSMAFVSKSIPLFTGLLSMLGELYPRIAVEDRTQFLLTSLPAVLASFVRAKAKTGEATGPVIGVGRMVTGPSSGFVSMDDLMLDEPVSVPSPSDIMVHKQLVVAFVTQAVDTLFRSIPPDDEVPGLGFTSRLKEKLHPELPKPGKETCTARIMDSKSPLGRHDGNLSMLLSVARTAAATDVTLQEIAEGLSFELEEDLGVDSYSPSARIDPCPSGALVLLAKGLVWSGLTGQDQATLRSLNIFPSHASLVASAAKRDKDNYYAVTDSLLAIGYLAISHGTIGEPSDDTEVLTYLQNLSDIAATSPSPNLRFHTLGQTTKVLDAHPDPAVRMSFIKDTLERCTSDALKVTAVDWLQAELFRADPDKPNSTSSSATLDQVAPFLFTTGTLVSSPLDTSQQWPAVTAKLRFQLAAVNLYRLVICAPEMRWDVLTFHKRHELERKFLAQLEQAIQHIWTAVTALPSGPEQETVTAEETRGNLVMLEDAIGRVRQRVVELTVARLEI